jgi:hypothetical protein
MKKMLTEAVEHFQSTCENVPCHFCGKKIKKKIREEKHQKNYKNKIFIFPYDHFRKR